MKETMWPKESGLSDGYVIKMTAMVKHECCDCGRFIEAGQEYYRLSLERWDYGRGYYPKCICEQCWMGKEPVQ